MSYVSGMGYTDDGRGVGTVDWDGDGDLDAVLNNRTSPRVRIMRNEYDGPHRSVLLQLVGTAGNRDAVGARVMLHTGDRTLSRTVRASDNYMVQGSRWVHFGLGRDGEVRSLTVRWPNGKTESISGVRPGARYRVIEGTGIATAVKSRSSGFDKLPAAELEPVQASDKALITLAARPPVPDFPITDFDGKEHVLSKMQGRPVLINFWASWCPGCIEELTGFVEARESLERSGVQILALSVEEPSERAAAVAKAKALGLWFPRGLADQRLLDFLQAIRRDVIERHDDPPLPSSMLLDRKGRIARLYLGPVSARQVAFDATKLMSEGDEIETHHHMATLNGPGLWQIPQLIDKQMVLQRLHGLAQHLLFGGQHEDAYFYVRRLGDVLSQEQVTEAFATKAVSAMRSVAEHLKESAPEKAVDLYRRISKEFPDDASVLIELSNALLAIGTPEARQEAADVFDSALLWLPAPTDADQWVARGLMLGRLERWDEALPYFRRALELDENHVEAAVRLGHAMIETSGAPGADARSSQLEAGVAQLSEALAKAPPSAKYELILARALDGLGRGDEAVAHFARFLDLVSEPKTAADHAVIGATLFRVNRMEEAVPHLQKAASQGGGAETAWQLGLALLQLGRAAEALPHMERAIDRMPASASNHYYYGMTLARAGRMEEAVGRFEQALAMKPDLLDALHSLGVALDQLGKTEQAVQRYREYLRVKPDEPAVLTQLGGALQVLGRNQEAVDAYRKILAADPNSITAKYHLAWIYATAPDESLRDSEKAVQLAEEIAPAAPPGNPSMLDLLGAVYAEAGRFELAVQMASSALDSARSGNNEAFAQQIQQRLDLYKRSVPFRTSAQAQGG